MINDLLSDFLTRFRNAAAAGKKTTRVRYSRLVEAIADVLKSEGFIEKFEKDGYELEITLSDKLPLTRLKRLSRPSIRRYVGYQEIPRPRSGYGTVILTTPKGILTGNQARKQKVGGELICEIW